MSRVAVKFFRDPRDGEKALAELKAKGYKADEIGLITSGKDGKNVASARNGTVAGSGPVAAALNSGQDAAPALAEVWGVSEEAARYYLFGASMGSMVISVHADEQKNAEARKILRGIGGAVDACSVEVTSPGFTLAERMTSTNPSDSKLSGDFRKY